MRSDKPSDLAHRIWLKRAERARGIAAMLSAEDAKITEAYARDCEAEARQAARTKSVDQAAPVLRNRHEQA